MDETDELMAEVVEALFEVLVQGHFSHLIEMELTPSQAQLLWLLHREPRATGVLASHLGISRPAVTQLCDRLLAKNLIRRRESDTDRRSIVVELTAPGRAAMDSLRSRRTVALSELMARLEPDLRDGVMRGLSALTGDRPRPASASEAPLTGSRTATPPQEASNRSGKIQPARGRLRIEWD